METLAQIILLIACAYFVDCRFLQELHKHLPDEHHQTPVKTNVRDADAVIFPNDSDPNLYLNDSTNVIETVNVVSPNTQGNDEGIAKDSTINVEDAMPLISKIIPEVEVKDIFTNPVSDNTEIVNDKIVDDKKAFNEKQEEVFHTTVTNDIVTSKNQDSINNVEGIVTKVNDTVVNLKETEPNFSSRFGGNGNYMLVPVASNVQNFQLIKTNPNIMPIQDVQPTQSYLPTNDLNANNQQFLPSAPNVHYTVPNSAPNIGTNVQPANIAPNVGQYPANNVNYMAPQENTNTYVNVPNTYVINGQLYAAVTVPINANVPSTLYYVNPQASGFQVANNLPLYKLVTLNE